MIALTSKQSEALEFVIGYQAQHGGMAPTYDEIAAGLGLSSKSRVHHLLAALEGRGAIRQKKGCARAIEVVRDHTAEFHLRRLLKAMSDNDPLAISLAYEDALAAFPTGRASA